MSVRKPNFIERLAGKAINKLGKYLLKKVFDIELEPSSARGEDIHQELILSSGEAASGCQKRVSYRRGEEKKTIEVTIPQAVAPGTRIKLTGLGLPGKKPGDFYLHIKVKG